MGDNVEGPFLVSSVMCSCFTLSANFRGSELRSAFVAPLMSSLDQTEAVSDVSSGEPDFESLPSDPAAASSTFLSFSFEAAFPESVFLCLKRSSSFSI